MALLSLLARIGTSQPVEPMASLDELAADFDFAHFGRAPAHFDPHDVELLNARLLHQLDYRGGRRPPARRARPRQDWLLLRAQSRPPRRFRRLARRCFAATIDPPELSHDERLLMRDAAAAAGQIDWSQEPWHALTER